MSQQDAQTDFDLIVVGAGLSGLAAAYYWCNHIDASANILILEASPRIGGSSVAHHVTVDGRHMSSPGGAQELVFPASFSDAVKVTLCEIGIDLDALAENIDQTHYAKHGAKNHAFCFSAEQWGKHGIAIWEPNEGIDLSDAPLCDEAKSQLSQIFCGEVSWFQRLDEKEKLRALQTHSCAEILTEFGKCHPEVERFFAYSTSPSSGLPFCLHPALDAALVGYPPIGALAPALPGPWPGLTQAGTLFFDSYSPKTYRFPDGNATIARAFLAWLRPDLFEGRDVAARIRESYDAGLLRDTASGRRIHLEETVTAIEPLGDDRVVVEATSSHGRCAKYTSSAVIVATWASEVHNMVPSLSAQQKATASTMGRLPVVTATIALSNWRAWQKLGASILTWPGHPSWQRAELGFPVSLGGLAPSASADEPNTVTALGATTTLSKQILVAAKQGRAFLQQPNQAKYLQEEILRLLATALGPYGFDVQNDVRACDVELWPNGYSRYSTSLDARETSCATLRQKQELARGNGRILIAGSDVTDRPFLDAALEAAFDAVTALNERFPSFSDSSTTRLKHSPSTKSRIGLQ